MDNTYVWNYSHPTIPGVEVVERNCPICEEWHSISCDASKLEKYLENKNVETDQILPFFTKFELEFLETGICKDCYIAKISNQV